MSGHLSYPLSLHRRPRSWAVWVAVIALTAWLVQFSTHVHRGDEAQGSTPTSHHCGTCAAFQAGAGAPVLAFTDPVLRPVFAGTAVLLPAPRPAPQLPYRSRAPPHA